ncbi:MAG: hypothetical protein GVY13_13280 [Alphaproteobacteria bacterium]|jgi:redox-sensitive bicupin YhaK (pirin superfamily)|nr:hypothetical protein [Alphaproteobacteria bacterium]
MIERIPFDALGHADHGWLQARHHFSFAEYHDPHRMGLGPLRVWNDDTIAPGTGFAMHPHKDMEIITYVRDGAITHKDHLGNEGRTEAGDVQVMSAGTGIVHGEWNREEVPARIFQIWIRPAERGVAPHWDQRRFPKADRAGVLVPLASGRRAEIAAGALEIHQDAALYGATLAPGQTLNHRLEPGRRAYLVVALGSVTVNGTDLAERDGAAIRETDTVTVAAGPESAEVLLADLP